MKRLNTFNGYMMVNESREYENKLFKLFKGFLDRFYDYVGGISVELDSEHHNIIRIDFHYLAQEEGIKELWKILAELQNKQLRGRIQILDVDEYEDYDLAFDDPDTVSFIEILDN